MDFIKDLIIIIIVAGVGIYVALSFNFLKLFINSEKEKNKYALKKTNDSIVIPLRLQAYERLCLLLERISPSSLIMRVYDSSYSIEQLQELFLSNIRSEFEHNLSQQIYISSTAWDLVKNAKEDIISAINNAATQVKDPKDTQRYCSLIFEMTLENNQSRINIALEFLKNEIRNTF
ncbi:MAG: hypothetical protein A2X12_06900 [Bacteroidetes bacterium GWE2_29_8]|nr:MAG: hypothetical protein A2X12_06900 [Bacteroidetes bacterium GWE2_29_8]